MKEMKRDLAKRRKTVEMHEARFIRTDSKIMGIEKKLSEEVGILKELIEDMKKHGSGFSSGGSSYGDASTAPPSGGARGLPPKGQRKVVVFGGWERDTPRGIIEHRVRFVLRGQTSSMP